MEENSESLRQDLLELRDIKLWTLDQLLKEIEARSKQKFSGPSRARQILRLFLDEKDTPSNQAVFSRYMKDHHEDLVIEIKSWIKRALKRQEQISTRGIAERIGEEGKLKVKIFSSQVKSVRSFLKDNKIEMRVEKTILDVLNDQDNETLKEFFQNFDRKFREGLKLGTYKNKDYVPLLREKLEALASHLHRQSLTFKNDSIARGNIMTYLGKFDLVLPGKIKKTPMIAFLTDHRNKEFIRAQLIKIAPRWASEMNKDALITQFEEAASQHSQKECKFSKHAVGYNRLNILLNDNTVKEDGIYKLKSPKKREKKRKH